MGFDDSKPNNGKDNNANAPADGGLLDLDMMLGGPTTSAPMGDANNLVSGDMMDLFGGGAPV